MGTHLTGARAESGLDGCRRSYTAGDSRLAAPARTTGELAERFSTTRFAVMKHLAVLEKARLVVVRRSGRERCNHFNAVRCSGSMNAG